MFWFLFHFGPSSSVSLGQPPVLTPSEWGGGCPPHPAHLKQPDPLTYQVPASAMMAPGNTIPINVQVYFFLTFGGNKFRPPLLTLKASKCCCDALSLGSLPWRSWRPSLRRRLSLKPLALSTHLSPHSAAHLTLSFPFQDWWVWQRMNHMAIMVPKRQLPSKPPGEGGTQNGSTHAVSQQLCHFSPLATRSQQNPLSETGWGCKCLWNRAPPSPQAGDSRGRWNAPASCPEARPLPHTDPLEPHSSLFLHKDTIHTLPQGQVLPKKEKPRWAKSPPLDLQGQIHFQASPPSTRRLAASFLISSKGKPTRLKLWPFRSHLELLQWVINSLLNKSDPLLTRDLAAE